MSYYNTISIESFYPELIEILEVQEAIEEQLGEEVCKRIVKQFKEKTPYTEIEGDFEKIFDGKITIKIIEVKNQNGSGSVDTKLLAAPMFVEEYKLMLSDWDIEIEYIFCLNNYFKKQFDDETNRYYQNLKIILKKYNIKYLFGEASDYFENIDLIIFNK